MIYDIYRVQRGNLDDSGCGSFGKIRDFGMRFIRSDIDLMKCI